MEFEGDFTALRPFTKMVNVVSNTSAIAELRDSAGNGVKCNYIEVIPIAPSNGTGYVQVFLSGVEETPPDASGATTQAGRGSLGQVVGHGNKTVFSLDYGEECSGVILVNGLTADRDIAINYGVRKPQRPKFTMIKTPNLGAK